MLRVKIPTFHLMESKIKTGKGKDVEKSGSKRKRQEKLQDIEDLEKKMLKIARRITKPNPERVTQPVYERVGLPLKDIEDDNSFNEWVENNLPSHYYKSNGVHWISVVRKRRYDDTENETKNIPDIFGLQSAFKDTKVVNKKTLKKLAKKYSLTSGKWMLFGKTGCEINRLWGIVANGIIRGTIPSLSAKVSAKSGEHDNHVICIYNDNFLNDEEVFALRDGIRNSMIDQPLKYKADLYTRLGIYSTNTWGIDPVLYRDEVEDIINDKQPSISAVAGITLTREYSPLLSIASITMNSPVPITLGIKSISRLEKYGKGDEQVRLSILFHDGNTCLKGIAFGASARKWKETLEFRCTYKIHNYMIKESNRKYNNTKYEIYLWETTVFKKLKNGYAKIPNEKRMTISDLDQQFENLLVSTSKVMFTKIGESMRPKEKFLREVYIKDSTGQIKIKMWSLEENEFPYNVGDYVKLKYVYLRYDSFFGQYFLENNDNMRIFKCNE
ncbi:unnamed protein product [Mytilus coruscus]|uniref:Uncharacterized protein n=1 Tax=Mytilus coruscus TaxID=42192 RepID=A0A6J8DAM3_MYTCO|nr:unnamed protein product [Mytilus coruscus]